MSNNHKISILEKVNQMFVCSICCDNKSNSNSKTFSTSNPSLFLEHHRCCHPSVNEFECIYCCSYLPSGDLMQHIQNHFTDPAADSRYKCPHCMARVKVNMNSSLDHIEFEHPDNSSFDCPHCRSQFLDRSDLFAHFKKIFLYVFHCSFENCFVKSHNMMGVLNHLKRMHNGSRCLKVECLFTCTERISLKSQCNCMTNMQPSPQSPMKINSPTGDDCQLIALPYSARVLNKLSSGFDERLRDDLINKMAQYSKFKVRLEIVDGQKQFVCSTCQYRSVHSLADVRKHILGCHCSVSTSYTRLCLRASRLDTNNFSLFSDRKLISFANEKLKRAESGTGWDANGDTSAMQLLDDSEPEQESPIDASNRPLKRSAAVSGGGGGGGSVGSIKRAKLTQRQSHSAKMRPDSPVPEVGLPLERNEKIDRTIHLNYSWHVLERLVTGQCPERYLPILRQKMDVYALHRILLTRRNGKRYFLCSHCPNCSPHGMNDIRKHILGVHARLPERFKAAAMYCSRMNRDNYGLLSDDELLKKNQDMVRWRSVPPSSNASDDNIMEPLPPLHPATTTGTSCCYDDNSPLSQHQHSNSNNGNNNNNNNNNKSSSSQHNIFLSGDNNGDCSPYYSSMMMMEASVFPNQLFTDSCESGDLNKLSIMHNSSFTFNTFPAASIAINNNNNDNNNDNNNSSGLADCCSMATTIKLSPRVASSESSPKIDDNSIFPPSINKLKQQLTNGRSRRSLALKSKSSSANNSNNNSNSNQNNHHSYVSNTTTI